MKKALVYFYALIGGIVVPGVIGLGVGDLLMAVYENLWHHWIAGAAVCFLSGAVASWFPMQFLIQPGFGFFDGVKGGAEREGFWFLEREDIRFVALLGWAGGIVAPLVLGFQSLGKILAVLLILTTVITISSVLKAFGETSRRLDDLRKREESQQSSPPSSRP